MQEKNDTGCAEDPRDVSVLRLGIKADWARRWLCYYVSSRHEKDEKLSSLLVYGCVANLHHKSSRTDTVIFLLRSVKNKKVVRRAHCNGQVGDRFIYKVHPFVTLRLEQRSSVHHKTGLSLARISTLASQNRTLSHHAVGSEPTAVAGLRERFSGGPVVWAYFFSSAGGAAPPVVGRPIKILNES